MSNLLSFLKELAINPRQQEAFAKNPEAIMNEQGLSVYEQSLFKSGNPEQFAVNFADKQFQPAIVTGDPNPDPLPDPDPPGVKSSHRINLALQHI